jgi:uncharacterized membrane protein YqjE
MNTLPLIISGLSGTAGRFSGIAGQVLQDRLELLALELREAKIRFIQALLLACMGVVFFLFGLLLLVLACLYVLPVEWRLYGLAGAALISLVAGSVVFMILRRHLVRKPLAFDQSLTELQKDMKCFSTRI